MIPHQNGGGSLAARAARRFSSSANSHRWRLRSCSLMARSAASADMTLARESRALTLKQGQNELQFSWENTLIDPTSLEMLPKARAGEIDIANLTFPPRVRNLGLWNIKSEFSGKVPVEITYLTSGLSWRAFYMGTLTQNEAEDAASGLRPCNQQLRRRLRKLPRQDSSLARFTCSIR